MKIQVNGIITITTAKNIQELLNDKQINIDSIVVAFNGNFIPRSQYHSQLLEEECRIELLTAMQGG